MVATPDFLSHVSRIPDHRAARVRASATVCAAGQSAKVALRTLRDDLDRADRLHLLDPAAQRLLALHRGLVRPSLHELPDRIDALLELSDEVPTAAAAVGLDGPRKRRIAGRAAALRGALGVHGSLVA